MAAGCLERQFQQQPRRQVWPRPLGSSCKRDGVVFGFFALKVNRQTPKSVFGFRDFQNRRHKSHCWRGDCGLWKRAAGQVWPLWKKHAQPAELLTVATKTYWFKAAGVEPPGGGRRGRLACGARGAELTKREGPGPSDGRAMPGVRRAPTPTAQCATASIVTCIQNQSVDALILPLHHPDQGLWDGRQDSNDTCAHPPVRCTSRPGSALDPLTALGPNI